MKEWGLRASKKIGVKRTQQARHVGTFPGSPFITVSGKTLACRQILRLYDRFRLRNSFIFSVDEGRHDRDRGHRASGPRSTVIRVRPTGASQAHMYSPRSWEPSPPPSKVSRWTRERGGGEKGIARQLCSPFPGPSCRVLWHSSERIHLNITNCALNPSKSSTKRPKWSSLSPMRSPPPLRARFLELGAGPSLIL